MLTARKCPISCLPEWSTSTAIAPGSFSSNGCRAGSRTTLTPSRAAGYTGSLTNPPGQHRSQTIWNRAVGRSVLLSSEKLGVVAKADLLESTGDGEVVPVDYKKGSPPDNPERSWEPERVQLCLLGLLLREQGYRCQHGVLYFAEACTRVLVPFDDELITRTLGLLSDIRTTASSEVAPDPLVESAKCPRCSLVGICLPDETNALAARSTAPPRRLIPRSDDAKPLYVTEQGAHLGLDKGRITVRKGADELASVRCDRRRGAVRVRERPDQLSATPSPDDP